METEIFQSLYNKLNPEQRNQILLFIFKQEDNLKNLYLGAVERGIKALFLINAGGVVTVLAYIFKQASSCSKALLFISLLCFLLGLMTAVLVVLLDFNSMYSAYNDYRARLDRYYKSEISYFQLSNIATGTIKTSVIVGIGYLSTICIPLGVLFGLIGYFM